MKFELISIGDELLSGATVNTNASYLARRLSESGYEVDRIVTIQDKKEDIKAAFEKVLRTPGIAIATGGLGTTHDDLTVEVALSLFKEPPKALKNFWGTADGWDFEGRLFLLPGVPMQMEEIFEAHLLPSLLQNVPAERTFRSVNLALLSEDVVDPFLVHLQKEHPKVKMGICPSYGKLAVHFSGHGDMTPLVEDLRTQFPEALFEEPSLAHVIHRMMIQEGLTLALAESCTGGNISKALTAIPGASTYFLGSLVCYSNELKEKILSVDPHLIQKHGAVSEECVTAMASGLSSKTKANYVVAVSGVAGPTGGTETTPVGTVWIAIGDVQGDIETFCIQAKGKTRATIIEYTTQMVLARLWKRLTA